MKKKREQKNRRKLEATEAWKVARKLTSKVAREKKTVKKDKKIIKQKKKKKKKNR